MTHKKILGLGFLIGLLSLALSIQGDFDLPRWILGTSFVYFFSGYPLSLLLLPKTNSLLERLLVTCGLGLLLTYPAGFLNVLWEGQSGLAIFGYHLSGDLSSILGIYLFLILLLKIKRANLDTKIEHWPRPRLILLIPIVVSIFMNFYQLGKPDLNGDEYDLGYQAYNLVDGIFAGRKAYVLSFSAHPPLTMYIQHFSMNILSPNGLDSLSDGMYRVSPALVGVLTVAVVYLFTKEMGLGKIALVAASLLAVNGYQIFISRIFHRESFLALFLALTLYIFVRYLKTKYFRYLLMSGAFFGAAMLTKANALIILPVIFVGLWWNDRKNILGSLKIFALTSGTLFLPVVIYNLGSYVTTGYTDIFFSRIFQTPTHPGARIATVNVIQNLQNILQIGMDQYGVLLYTIIIISLIVSLSMFRDKQARLLLVWTASTLLFFGVNGTRVYYLPFITIPLLALTMIILDRYVRNKLLFATIAIILFTVSFIRSSKTFFDYSFITPLRNNDEIPSVKETFLSSYSLTSRRWLENRGWKKLGTDLKQVNTKNSCLIVDPDVSDLLLRRYLGVNDKIREFYLRQEHVEPYKMCTEATNLSKVTIYYDSQGIIRAKLL